ncbi:histidinol-phosphate transaminase [Candidatus Bipolaricaulota bacterium]|nr:histidinol-phosphate transaminase [Candidatus Bipolaricaulota bacterium]
MSKGIQQQPGLDSIKPYIPGKPIEDVKREYGLDDVIKLASNENPRGVSPKALLAMKEALIRLNHYPDGSGYEFRSALAKHFDVSMEQVAIGNGADDLILELSMAYLEDGDEVVVSRSSFPMYDIYASAMRAVMVKTPLTHDLGIDLDAMAQAITDRTKLIYVCNPNNPTGTMVSADAVDAFIHRVPENVLIVLDEAYAEMVDSNDYPDSLAYVREGRKNVFVLRTFSKVYGLAGIRIGYGFGHPDIVATLFRIKPPFNVNVLAQVAGMAALQDADFVAKSVSDNKAGREYLYSEFDRLGIAYAPSHTNFVLMKVGGKALEVQQELLKRGVIIRPCGGYDLPEHLRVSIGAMDQNKRFIDALRGILGR